MALRRTFPRYRSLDEQFSLERADVVGSEGGVPKRLTWHPGTDIAQGFTADGNSVLFTSPRNVYTARYTQLDTVPVEGGAEELLPIPHSEKVMYSPVGKRIAYNPLGPRFLQ